MERLPGFSGIFQCTCAPVCFLPSPTELFAIFHVHLLYVVDDWHVAVQSRYPFNNNIKTQVLAFFIPPMFVCLLLLPTSPP